MRKTTLLITALLCAWVYLVPAYAGTTGGGELAVKLVVDAGGPRGHKPKHTRVKVRIIVSRAGSKATERTESYANAGHVFHYVLAPGSYTVKAWLLPPVVNPVPLKCRGASNVVVHKAALSRASVKCVLVG